MPDNGCEYYWRSQCGNSACWDLCGGEQATANPTVTLKHHLVLIKDILILKFIIWKQIIFMARIKLESLEVWSYLNTIDNHDLIEDSLKY